MKKISTEEHRDRCAALGKKFIDSFYKDGITMLRVAGSCGHEWEARSGDLYNKKTGCPICYSTRFLTVDEHRSRLADLGYRLKTDTVKKAHAKVPVEHIECGHIWEVSLSSLYGRGGGCPACKFRKQGDRCRTPIEKHKERLASMGYELVSESVPNVDSNVMVKHLTCGTVWPVKLLNLYNLHGCPTCSIYKGQKETGQILLSMFKRVARQAPIKSKEHPNKLFFDYQVQDNQTMVEYHGQQHYCPIDFFGGMEQFAKRQKLDAIKERWCIRNNYRLIVVPYWIKDIRSYLVDQFSLIV